MLSIAGRIFAEERRKLCVRTFSDFKINRETFEKNILIMKLYIIRIVY
jgi:hypothetical protein